MAHTDKQALAEARLGQPLAQWLGDRRGTPWRALAEDFRFATNGVRVSPETLRQWTAELSDVGGTVTAA